MGKLAYSPNNSGIEMTTINSQEDLLRALWENPEWKEAVVL